MSIRQSYRLILALAGTTGVSMQLAQDGWGMLLYYTVLSNILVTAFLYYLVYREYQQTHTCRHLLRLKGAVTLAIAITFVIYHFMLAPLAKPEDYWNVRNFLVHYIVPLGFLLDGLIFDPKGLYGRLDPLMWTLLPLIYCLFALFNGLVLQLPIPGAKDSPFPYFFLNVHTQGAKGVASYIIVIFLAYLLGSYSWLALKRVVGPKA